MLPSLKKSLPQVVLVGALSMLFLSVPASATDVLIYSRDFAEAESDTLILDFNNDATDITLQFGDTLAEQLFWDNSATAFTFTDDLSIHGTTIELDSDNSGTGATIDIIANQGSEADGTLRYNTTTNQWEISNNGGGFNAISTGVTLDQAYDQGGAGSGRVITTDSGAVELSGSGELLHLGDGSAADSFIRFDDGAARDLGWDDSLSSLSTFNSQLSYRTMQSSAPPFGCDFTVAGMQWMDTDTGIVYSCDTSNGRNEWLSITEIMLTGGESASCAAGAASSAEGCTQDIHNGTDANDLGFQIPREATIVGGSFHSDVSCTNGSGVALEVATGDNGGVAFLADILTSCTDANGCSAVGTDIDVSTDTIIRARLDNDCSSGSVTDWSSIILLRWRHP